MPLLSIIIPKKPTSPLDASFILPSIESQQANFDDVEIIVASSLLNGENYIPLDLTSLPKVNKVTKQYSETCFMRTPGNSRNIGLNHATGKFVVFWDYDDYLRDVHTLQDILNLIQGLSDDVQLIECNYTLDRQGILEPNVIEDVSSFFISVWNYIFRKSLLDEHDLRFQSTFHAFEDTHFVWDALNLVGFDRNKAIPMYEDFYVHRETSSDPNAQYHIQTHSSHFIMDLFRTAQDYYLSGGDWPAILYRQYLGWFFNRKSYPDSIYPQWVIARERADFRYFLTYMDPDRKLISETSLNIRGESFKYSIVIDKNADMETTLYLLNDQWDVDYADIEILIPRSPIDVSKYSHISNCIYFLDAHTPKDLILLSNKVIWIKSEKAVSNVYYLRDTIDKFKFLNSSTKIMSPNDTNYSVICSGETFGEQPSFVSQSYSPETNKIISFIIPYHNEAYDIYEPLFTSINNQTGIDFNDIEILICRGDNENVMPDTSSFDNIAPIVQNIVTQGINGSPGFNRSLGIQHATGKYIAFLDIDDELVSNDILSGLIAEIRNNDYPDIVDMPFISEVSEGTQYYVDNKTPFQLWSSVYKLSYIKENQIDFTPRYYGEDLTFVIEADSCNPVRHYFNKYFYKYKLRDNSAVTQRIAKYEIFVSDTVQIYTDLRDWRNRTLPNNHSYDTRFLFNIYPLLGRELNSQIFSKLPVKTQFTCIDILEEMITYYKPLINISPNVSDSTKNAQDLIEKFISEVKI